MGPRLCDAFWQVLCSPCSTDDSVLRYQRPKRRLLIYSVIWLLLCYLWNSSVCSIVCREQAHSQETPVLWQDLHALLAIFQLPGPRACCQMKMQCMGFSDSSVCPHDMLFQTPKGFTWRVWVPEFAAANCSLPIPGHSWMRVGSSSKLHLPYIICSWVILLHLRHICFCKNILYLS